jgi:hypothetical protein
MERIRRRLSRRNAWRSLLYGDGEAFTPDAKFAMREFAKYCGAYSHITMISPTTKMVDVNATLIAEGRRQAYNYIIAALNDDPDNVLSKLEKMP